MALLKIAPVLYVHCVTNDKFNLFQAENYFFNQEIPKRAQNIGIVVGLKTYLGFFMDLDLDVHEVYIVHCTMYNEKGGGGRNINMLYLV